MILVIARLHIRAGAMERMLSEVASMARYSRAEPGCKAYTYLRSPEDDALLVFVELWEDRPSLEQHLGSERMSAYRASTADFVATRVLDVFDAKPAA